ncbi:ribulokinase [Mycobacterium adipatum]|jgi:L-ribulokinase|uniref:ribulokinase n=1 Tax=Mycobacterium adipatum TaxID=1682113 RepID=UPI0034E0DD39
MSPEKYTVGVDFGTLSGRAVVVRVSDGHQLAAAEHAYRHGVITDTLPGNTRSLPAQWALQVPEDYLDVLRTAVPAAVAESGVDPEDIIGIGTDFTACTMVPVREDGTPLCQLEGFADRAHAYGKLWRHHSPQPQADEINALAAQRGESWLPRYGGLISSEWEFAKGLEIFDEDPQVYQAMDHFVEAADWIVWQLCGTYVRNACSAGYKGIRQEGQYPSRQFLAELRPGFQDFVTEKLDASIGVLGDRAGSLTVEASEWTGLPVGIAVAVGNVDAHVTVAAADALEPGHLVAIMGTSTCHVLNSDVLRDVPGMCGVVDGGISAGSWGYEAGQSGVGDIFGWYVDNCVPESFQVQARRRGISLHDHLTELAGRQQVGEHGLVALDWHSGNRSVLVDHELSGVMIGQTLHTTCVDMYRALLEATAFGTRMIVETFVNSGIRVDELVVAGGLLKNHLLMQIYADVVGLPLSTVPSTQAPALGSAIHAAVAAGAYPDVYAAARRMGSRTRNAYLPIAHNVAAYDRLYREYVAAHDWFGRGNDMMRRLRRIATPEPVGASR